MSARNRFGRRQQNGSTDTSKFDGLEIVEYGDAEKAAIHVTDALRARLDDCGHMSVTDDIFKVRNHYPEKPNKDASDSIVQVLRVFCGEERGTETVPACTCEDFMYRRTPQGKELESGERTEPLDVPAEDLGPVLWSVGRCKHIQFAEMEGRI